MKIRLNPIDRLIQVLEGQRTVYAALLLLYQQNQAAMLAWDLVSLKTLFPEEQKLLRELNLLEQRRISAVLQIVRELQLPAEQPLSQSRLLSSLQPYAEERQILHLQRLGEEIAVNMQQLEQAREPLLPVLQSALAFLARHDKSRTAVSAAPYGNAGKPGSSLQTRNTPILDKKV